MCKTPITLPNGQEVACRNCDLCRDNATNDWVGRCIAEQRTSYATFSITLTYGRDSEGNEHHERSTVLTYSDWQLYAKRLRAAGYPFRYLLAGEYGTLKQRAHWHAIMFFQSERVPPHKMFEIFNEPLWPHGHQLWKKPTPKHTKYCCKYIRKDATDKNAQGKFMMSKKPPIGGQFFVRRAAEMVKQGLVPHNPFYSFPEARKKNGQPVQFMLRGVMSDKFREAYVTAYRMAHPGAHLPNSEYVEEWLDRQVEEWRLPDKWPRLPKQLEAIEEVKVELAREEYKRKHNLFYFGKYNMGLYDIDWSPDDGEN